MFTFEGETNVQMIDKPLNMLVNRKGPGSTAGKIRKQCNKESQGKGKRQATSFMLKVRSSKSF